MVVFMVILGVLLYSAVAGGTYYFATSRCFVGDEVGAAYVSIVWPLTLPAMAVYYWMYTRG